MVDLRAHTVASDGGDRPDELTAAAAGVGVLAIVSSTLYVGGHFTTVGGTDRGHLAALSASGGLRGRVHPGLRRRPLGSRSSPAPPSQLSKFH
jgi:hypothetical protein